MRNKTPSHFAAALMSACLVLQTSCKDILEVQLPGKVTEDALDNPLLAQVIANGVILDFECAWSNYVTATNALSDQLVNASQQGVSSAWYLRNILDNDPALLTNCDGATGLFPYAPLQIARRNAERASVTIASYSAATVPSKPLLAAQVKTYGAFALIPLGEGFCEMALEPKQIQTPKAVLQVAETQLTEALTLATAANSTDLVNMALVGRARVRLDLDNFAGARADAALVPAGYLKVATRGAAERQRWNLTFEFQNNTTASSSRHGSVAPNFRAVTWQGVADPRVTVTANGNSQDGVTPFFQHTKGLSRSDGVPIASYKEAQLIIAEAAARSGDLTTARQIINARHTAAGILGYDLAATATQAEVIGQVIEERSRELFLEAGHRYNDMLRFRTTQWKIPFRGEAGSIHPTGSDQAGRLYGTTTCIPLPFAEK
jgi:starch-binding outer membrane protein, SusD/RagB family